MKSTEPRTRESEAVKAEPIYISRWGHHSQEGIITTTSEINKGSTIFHFIHAFPGGSVLKNTGDTCLIPGYGISPGGDLATHSSILAWKIPWTKERVRHDWVTKYDITHQKRKGIRKDWPKAEDLIIHDIPLHWIPSFSGQGLTQAKRDRELDRIWDWRFDLVCSGLHIPWNYLENRAIFSQSSIKEDLF